MEDYFAAKAAAVHAGALRARLVVVVDDDWGAGSPPRQAPASR